MKRVILSTLILVIALSLFMGVATVSAEGEPTLDKSQIKQINEGIVFHNASNPLQGDIILPTGYWVIGDKVNESFYEVSYNGVKLLVDKNIWNNMTAYRSTDKINTIQYAPSGVLTVVFPDGIITPTIPLFKDKECDPSSLGTTYNTLSNNEVLTFLNVFENSKKHVVYLVATADNKIGYVPASYTSRKDLDAIRVPEWQKPESETPVEPEKPPAEPETPTEPDDTKPGEGAIPDTGAGGNDVSGGDGSIIKPNEDSKPLPTKNNIVKVVLIVCICILAGVLVFLIFKPTRNRLHGGYSLDDEDNARDDSYNDNY